MTTEPAATALAENRFRPGPFAGLSADDRPGDLNAAYDLQDALHGLLATRLGSQVGHKVGCTSKAMQDYMNIPSPAAGGVFQSTVQESAVSQPWSDFNQVGVECEVAVTLSDDLSGGDTHSRESVAVAVASVHAAIEIVDDRYADWRSLDLETMVADDFFQAGAVLGPAVTDWWDMDLAAVQGRTLVNGEERGAGVGADILGHPLEVLAWLANHKAARGQSLKAGEIILLGSMVQVQWLAPGDKAVVEVSELGTVSAEFTA